MIPYSTRTTNRRFGKWGNPWVIRFHMPPTSDRRHRRHFYQENVCFGCRVGHYDYFFSLDYQQYCFFSPKHFTAAIIVAIIILLVRTRINPFDLPYSYYPPTMAPMLVHNTQSSNSSLFPNYRYCRDSSNNKYNSTNKSFDAASTSNRTKNMVVNRHVTWNESVRVQYFVVLSSPSSTMTGITSLGGEGKDTNGENNNNNNNMERQRSLSLMPQERQWHNRRPSSPPPLLPSSLYPCCNDKNDTDDNDKDSAIAPSSLNGILPSLLFSPQTTKTFEKSTFRYNNHNRTTTTATTGTTTWEEESSSSSSSSSTQNPDEFSLKEMRRMIDFICPNPSCRVPLFEPCKCGSSSTLVVLDEDVHVMNNVSFLSSFFVETLDTY